MLEFDDTTSDSNFLVYHYSTKARILPVSVNEKHLAKFSCEIHRSKSSIVHELQRKALRLRKTSKTDRKSLMTCKVTVKLLVDIYWSTKCYRQFSCLTSLLVQISELNSYISHVFSENETNKWLFNIANYCIAIYWCLAC